MRRLAWIGVSLVVIGTALFGWAYSGRYDVGADSPHWAVTTDVLATVRDRSIETRAAALKVPDLDDPELVSLGATHYAEMCVSCHRAPSVAESELRQGLNPAPPDLTRGVPPPAETFWVIKHGIKMSGMPAWGTTHDDHQVWAMVAFVQKLPGLDAAAYAALTGDAASAEEHEPHHDHHLPDEESPHQH